MARTFLSSFLCCLLIFSCTQVKQVQHRPQLPSAIPALRITNDTTAVAIKISTLKIDVTVAANIATTTFDITFYNPNSRILEGEFEFPLADGQHIVRYALDMEGALREGVVVEKAKARAAFENTIRRNIDPGLVEKTKGNNFRTRIYPLPANGTRHILIAVEQTMELQQNELVYQLPLFAPEPIDHFAIKTTIVRNKEKPVPDENAHSHFAFQKWNNDWVADYEKNNFTANQNFSFAIPATANNETIQLAEKHNGQTYFYVNSRIAAENKKKTPPASVTVLWDISSSGEKRNIEKEKELLKAYLAALGHVKVSLVPFHVFAEEKQDIEISNGNCEALLEKINHLQYDGGTQFGSISLPQYNTEEILLFSDGLSTFGNKEMVLSGVPVITINSSPSADISNLKYIARESRGQYIALNNLAVPAALAALQNQSLQVVNVEYNKAEIEDLVLPALPAINQGLSFAGKLKVPSATVTISIGYGTESISTKTFVLTNPEKNDYDQVKRIWATMRIAALDLQYEKNKSDITKLGKEFSIVTQNTSLIVLDRVEDYVEHEIVPPLSLQSQYYSLLKEKQQNKTMESGLAISEAVDAMNTLKKWWTKKPSGKKNTKPVDESTAEAVTINNLSLADTTTIVVAGSLTATGSTVQHFSISTDESAVINPAHQGFAGEYKWELGAGDNKLSLTDSTGSEEEDTPFTAVEIALNEWNPDVPYLKILTPLTAAERKARYYSLKKEYASQPSFFIDVARLFMEKNDKPFGIRILSNVAEMKLEDASLLRMVANELLDAGETTLAIETFKDVLTMREEEPQSYRDLALACNDAGQYDKAVELLYTLLTRSWDSRFGDVKSITLNEMNAIISAHPEAVNTSAVDKRLIYAMPVDVRIVINWNTDNSDIDLWVTDPGKEKCYYENQATAIGGKISADVTQGYGPEEFCLRKALNGNYLVDVNLFGDSRQTMGGPIAIKADLFTDYGKPSQKKKTINFRVTTNKEVINLGALKFGS